jgi:hypothetical protein
MRLYPLILLILLKLTLIEDITSTHSLFILSVPEIPTTLPDVENSFRTASKSPQSPNPNAIKVPGIITCLFEGQISIC